MAYDTILRITPELAGIAIGFGLRHFLMPLISGKEVGNLIKYLRQHEMTKDEQAELKFNLAETKCWIELHANHCPYVKHELVETKALLRQITDRRE